MNSLSQRDIKFLKGVGPKRAELLLKELGISTFYDLLTHYPTHYLDRTKIYRISELTEDMSMVQVRGRFVTFTLRGEGAKTRMVGLFSDGHSTMEVVWFRQIRKLKDAYHTGNEYILFGKPTYYNGIAQMVHPEVDSPSSLTASAGLRGVYPLTEKLRNGGFSSRTFHSLAMSVLAATPTINDPMPADIISRNGFMSLREALTAIHNPRSHQEAARARERLKFDELFYLQLDILRYARGRKQSIGGYRFSRIGDYFNRFYFEQLPFALTGAQKRVIKEIRADMGSGRQMNRLLQGDVGSGKTLVALLCMLIALDNGMQACLMAPTEILATQHYETLRSLTAPLGISIALLTGSTPAGRRREIHTGLMGGSIHILIGTHAVLENPVEFAHLGFAVIDEQHRFGVAQRARLWGKSTMPPHVLVMTATPIPRTLAMTVYGDLDVSVIDELPPGRKPVVTLLRYDENREQVYRAIGSQLNEGRQVYIVHPLIKDNDKLALKSLEEGYETICNVFPHRKVAFVHGQMKPAEKDYQMQLFASGAADILVATTVIEVGVNVPNASVMVIENAERFGLSQLHQLRGRVGRGADQSYCILMSKRTISRDTRKRLEIMTSTSDGFLIAEADMKLRGPGDIEGTMQSGMAFDLKIASLAADGQILTLARREAESVLGHDPILTAHPALGARLKALFARNLDWSRIS